MVERVRGEATTRRGVTDGALSMTSTARQITVSGSSVLLSKFKFVLSERKRKRIMSELYRM